jgi:hypothetical protein
MPTEFAIIVKTFLKKISTPFQLVESVTWCTIVTLFAKGRTGVREITHAGAVIKV